MDNMFHKFVHKDFIKRELELSVLYGYLDKYKAADIGAFLLNDAIRNENVKLNHTIWMYWKQGMENAPMLVRKCYESVRGNKPQDFELILLTDKTLSGYIELPDYIWDKYEKGYITTTHLSDIIRMELLYTYGGCWIDATVFCSGAIPEYMLKGNMFVFKLPAVVSDPVLKMSSWWISSAYSNRLVQMTRRMLYEYWKQETDMRNYFLLHIMMSKLVDEDRECKDIFQKIPYFNSGNAHVLQEKLGSEYTKDEWRIIKDISPVHKLTYKYRYLRGDLYNYYTVLMMDKL